MHLGGEREEYTLQNIDPSQMFSLLLDTASYYMVSGQPKMTCLCFTIKGQERLGRNTNFCLKPLISLS